MVFAEYQKPKMVPMIFLLFKRLSCLFETCWENKFEIQKDSQNVKLKIIERANNDRKPNILISRKWLCILIKRI